MDWIKGLGLDPTQVAKVIVTHPQVLGCRIDDNLQPTVDWIKGVGLSQSDVAEAIVKFPQLVSLSVEKNLRGKHRLLLRCFPAAEVASLWQECRHFWAIAMLAFSEGWMFWSLAESFPSLRAP